MKKLRFNHNYIPRAGTRAMSVRVCGLAAEAAVANGAQCFWVLLSRQKYRRIYAAFFTAAGSSSIISVTSFCIFSSQLACS